MYEIYNQTFVFDFYIYVVPFEAAQATITVCVKMSNI